MATMFDFNFLEENLLYLEVFGQEWIIPLVLTLLFMLIVTRDTNKFSSLFLPMLIGVKLMGFYIPLAIYIPLVTFGGFLYIVSALGTDVVGTFISASASSTKSLIQSSSLSARQERAIKKYHRTTAWEKLASKRRGDKTPDEIANLLKDSTYNPNYATFQLEKDRAKDIKGLVFPWQGFPEHSVTTHKGVKSYGGKTLGKRGISPIKDFIHVLDSKSLTRAVQNEADRKKLAKIMAIKETPLYIPKKYKDSDFKDPFNIMTKQTKFNKKYMEKSKYWSPKSMLKRRKSLEGRTDYEYF